MNKIITIIVDDEVLARERIRTLLKDDDEFEIVAECKNGKQAIEQITKHTPDLIFLDIQMPEIDGFGVLQNLSGINLPAVVFVTAYDKYAIKAFDVNALDYLLKPFDRGRFNATIERAKKNFKSNSIKYSEKIFELLKSIDDDKSDLFLKKLVIKNAGRVYFINTNDIDLVEAAGNYATIYTGKNSHLYRETMSNLESQLNPRKFIRIHRSYIVNPDCIIEMKPWFNGEYIVKLKNGMEIKSSRSYKENVNLILTSH